METLTGILLVVSAGLLIGSMSWPMKVCPNLSFGHMRLSGMVAGLLVAPWLIALLGVPNLFAAYAEVPLGTLLKANLFSLAWGIANVLFGISVTRIGASLSMAILTGIGASLGVTLPMILKGSGLFAGAPSIVSMPGAVVLLGVAIMLAGVVLCGRSGLLRESAVGASAAPQGSYATNMLIIAVCGILSAGISFTFIFSQDEIVRAVTAQGAGPVAANASVWAIALLAGMLVNVVYPAILITREGSWGRFAQYPGQVLVSAMIGIQFFAGVLLLGQGMLALGVLGASVGFGMSQGMQIIGGQILGFVSGEWKGAPSKARSLIFLAIALLLVAAVVLALANTLPK
jgi:L-rhamnose-H+ transport protein